ncbi:MAG: tyrosine--tRNA ligase [Elusimicrobia bacterium RIFOXYA2_FULL_50_26]|nr:MAG: tyrosine--tRNA ligase [Elusimicrobia bacterium RIFOXYA2_FULL_50_26]OGS24978.1 MAG: tyrosine--tRNA ligase [Elusimicrobia bacterium RIFOXYB2_FULL_50_12]
MNKTIIEKIRRGTVEIISEKELENKLQRGKPLRIKLGVDPTAPDMHLGHTVLLNKLRVFQDMGHTIVFIIGDFTARIGDPSGRSETRPIMSEEAILANAKTYQEQVYKILDEKKMEVVFNSSWLYPLGIEGLLKLASKYTVARMLERDDFEKRFKSATPISIIEFLYPLLQGYDSVAVRSDVELGGNDQKFNLLVGREMQKDAGQEPQVVITMPLLEGTDGVRKMSKSYGNYIALNDTPQDIFGKLMSVPDDIMYKYYELLTDADLKSVKAMHPREAKADLAEKLTARYHGLAAAKNARAGFDRIFSKKDTPEDIEHYACPHKTIKLTDLLLAAGLVSSKNEARRLIEQGGIKIDGEKVPSEKEIIIENECIIQAGKRKFKKVIPIK